MIMDFKNRNDVDNYMYKLFTSINNRKVNTKFIEYTKDKRIELLGFVLTIIIPSFSTYMSGDYNGAILVFVSTFIASFITIIIGYFHWKRIVKTDFKVNKKELLAKSIIFYEELQQLYPENEITAENMKLQTKILQVLKEIKV